MTDAPTSAKLKRYIGVKCGYVYDPQLGDSSQGVAPDTEFQNLPENWKCPKCKALKEKFLPEL